MFHCYYKGEILPVSECRIPANDLGLFRGYSVFDYFRTYQKKPFQWDWYWQRFENSAEKLNLKIPIEKSDAREVVNQLIRLSPQEECAIRFILTGGTTINGTDAEDPTLIIFSEKIAEVSESTYQQGIKIESREYLRDMAEAKSTDYKFLLTIRPELAKNGSYDVLYHQNGEISELSRSNIFLVKDNVLITPSRNILKGITRRKVLELAKDKYKIEERPVLFEELKNAEEVFTTSSTKKVLSITLIDDMIIGNGKPGPVSQSLLSAFNAFTLSC